MTRGKKADNGDEPTTGEVDNTPERGGLTTDDFAETREAVEADIAAREQFVKDHTLGEVQPVITTAEMKKEAKYFGRSEDEAKAQDAAAVPAGVSGEPAESTDDDAASGDST